MGKRAGSAPVRWREDTGWEFRCASCLERGGATAWWPLTDEYWIKSAGMLRCRACWLDLYRQNARARWRRDPEIARARMRARYRRNRKVLLLKRRVYYEDHRETILADRRRRYALARAA